MIKKVKFRKYKGFSSFDMSLRSFNVLVGPNNAGKSTAVTVLRLCAILLRLARRVKPSIAVEDNGRKVLAYPLSAARLRELPGYTDENVHYEFRNEEARIEITSDADFVITVVWPKDDDEPYFYMDYKPGMNVTRPSLVREHAPKVDVIPGLTPVENQEEILTETYVSNSLGSKLTSRHFRNHLYYLKKSNPDEFTATVEFMCHHTPEVNDISVRSMIATAAVELDVFFHEADSNSEREIFWAGDGLQIWLQVLYHCFRLKDVETLVLDEPDVFLHPDLQRRLVSVLEELGPQIVMATHAPEVIAESSRDSIVLVDRTRKSVRRVQDTAALDRLVSDLGSAFDLSIARALRSRVVLFVEGQDMKVLRVLAAKAGASNLSKERRPVAVVPLGGFSNWPLIEPFSWMKDGLLQDSVSVYVLLDRDYRDDDECHSIVSQLSDIDATCHIWRKKELESYFLVPATIARVSGINMEQAEELLNEAVEEQRGEVEANLFSKIQREKKTLNPKTVFEMVRDKMKDIWSTNEKKRSIAPPKAVITTLNKALREAGGRPVSVRKLADAMRQAELDSEVRTLLRDVESTIVERMR